MGVIIAIIAYVLTGAFLSGLIDEGDDTGFWVILWPVMIVLIVLFHVSEKVVDIGMDIRYTLQSWFE